MIECLHHNQKGAFSDIRSDNGTAHAGNHVRSIQSNRKETTAELSLKRNADCQAQHGT